MQVRQKSYADYSATRFSQPLDMEKSYTEKLYAILGWIYSDKNLKHKFNEADHPRDADGKFTEKDKPRNPNHVAEQIQKALLQKLRKIILAGNAETTPQEDDAPPERIPRNADYSNADFDEAVRQEYEYLRELTEKNKCEHMSIMTNDKKILGTWRGVSGKINEDEEITFLLDKSPPNSLSLLHTHTKDVGFSGVDLGTMSKNLSVRDISAQTPDGTVYYGSVGRNGKRPSYDEVVAIAKYEFMQLAKLPRYANMKENDVRLARLIRERNAILQKKYNWYLR